MKSIKILEPRTCEQEFIWIMSLRQNGKGTLLTAEFWLKGGKVQDTGIFLAMVKKPSPSEPSLWNE